MGDLFNITFDDDAVIAVLDGLEDLIDSPNFRQGMVDASTYVLKEAQKNLKKYIYDVPERWYRRGFGSGLYGKTMVTGLKTKFNTISTGVISAVDYAVHVHYGTGIYAEGGKGRKTPWVYMDEEGRFHRTVGVKPKPYLVDALLSSKEDVLKILKNSIL